MLHALLSTMHLVQTTTGSTLDRLAEWGPLGLLLWLVGEKVIPALLKIVRPEQERRARAEAAEAQRLQQLETRQVEAWAQVAEANQSLSKSLTMLSSAITTLDQRTAEMHAATITLLERTAGCDAKNAIIRARRNVDTGDAG